MYKHILHATDLLEHHFSIAKQAATIATYFKAKLFLLHVIEPPASLQLAQGLGFTEAMKPCPEDAQTVLQTLGQALNIPTDQQCVEIGSIKMHVLRKVKELNCGLLIIGKHTPSHLPSILESTAHSILQDAPCDVLTLAKI